MLRAARSLNGLSQQELADGASNFRPCLTAWEGIERQRSQRWRACAASMLTRNRRIWLASGIGLVRAGTSTLRSHSRWQTCCFRCRWSLDANPDPLSVEFGLARADGLWSDVCA